MPDLKPKLSPIKKVKDVFSRSPKPSISSPKLLTTTLESSSNKLNDITNTNTTNTGINNSTPTDPTTPQKSTLTTNDPTTISPTLEALLKNPPETLMETTYFNSPSSRECLSLNPGDAKHHAEARRKCTAENWKAEIERRIVGNSTMVDHAYGDGDPLRARAYGHGDGQM